MSGSGQRRWHGNGQRQQLQFIPVRTRMMLPPKDDLFDVLTHSLPELRSGDILVVTSKVLAIHQGRCVRMHEAQKHRLVQQEADAVLPNLKTSKRSSVILTIKGHTLIPSAGIDESNGNGYYMLWPTRISALLADIARILKKRYRIKRLGIIATDSHTIPLRYGVVGISIGSYGFEPLNDYRGSMDLFGRALRITRSNVVDALAAMSVLLMGEGKEQRPLLVIRNVECVRFTAKPSWHKLVIPPSVDLYAPILKAFRSTRRRPSLRGSRRHDD